MIYLDNNATSLLDPRVAERMLATSLKRPANPSSQHAAGRIARQFVEDARERLLQFVGAETWGMASDQLLFTSGGTEANNLAIFGLSEKRAGSIVVSAIEHPSVLGAAARLENAGRMVHRLPANPDGTTPLDRLSSLLSEQATAPVAMVSIMAANNETGVLQDIQTAARMCREHDVLFHTDAVQLLGKGDILFRDWGIDAMTITAHKIHGPVGVGALVVRHGIEITPQSFGGFQQLGLRPGTETPVLCDAFAYAVELALDHSAAMSTMRSLRDRLQSAIQDAIPNATINGADAPRLPHTLSVSFVGVDRQALQLALDMRGVACSTGSACASGSSEPSHVLVAMRLPHAVVQGGIRFSLSRETTEEDIDRTVDVLATLIPSLTKKQ